MGAYGDVRCEYCNKTYYEIDEHECSVEDLKERIRELVSSPLEGPIWDTNAYEGLVVHQD